MTNKKLFKSALIITAVMLSVSGCAGGCSKQAEPVIADATVETPEPEESIESVECTEPIPSPTVEPIQESIDDTISSESEDNIESEEVELDLDYTIIAIDEVTMYATTNANLRSGPDTTYDIVGSLTYAQEITVNGKVADGDKEWLVLKTEDGSTQMVSAKLVSRTKPQPQSSGGSSGGTTTTPSSGGNGGSGGSGGGQPSGNGDSVGFDDPNGMFSGMFEEGGLGDTDIHWDIE